MALALGVIVASFITTAPLLIAVAAAVFLPDARRRADARRIVRMLRTTRARSTEQTRSAPRDEGRARH